MQSSQERPVYDGFWLPLDVREQLLSRVEWQTTRIRNAMPAGDDPEAVAVRWPVLDRKNWDELAILLRKGRSVTARHVLERWQRVIAAAMDRLTVQAETMLPILATCTGYTENMIAQALQLGGLVDPAPLGAALRFRPTWESAHSWQRMPDLPGYVRFYPLGSLARMTGGLRRGASLCQPCRPLDTILGFAAGNVPGTALLIAMLAGLANSREEIDAPTATVLIRNSRHEPLFAPWVLNIIEEIDPELVGGLAILVWDYEDTSLQAQLMRQSDLMLAAAGDDTISSLETQRRQNAPRLRFHRHGHKVSFAAVDQRIPFGVPTARLAAVDSAMWDQNGCLSARVHFVLGDALDYAEELSSNMRELAARLPLGATPARLSHRAFDTYKALEDMGSVQVVSRYDDQFAVIVDGRTWNGESFQRTVNSCQGRVIIVRPVAQLEDIPATLRLIPGQNLQSLSVAIEPTRVLDLAQAVGACGVTAVRSLGRAAFPQLAYSWDGLLPIDIGWVRPEGHFTTVEFDDLEKELSITAQAWGN